jgi:predicted nucleotidyltransferase
MKTERKIIKIMLRENSGFTIRELSKKIKSDYKITHTAVKRLLQKKILSKKNIGKSVLCSLNKWIPCKELLFAEYERAYEVLKNKDIRQLFKEITSKMTTSFFIIILFGSFAKGNINRYSDIDLLFISNEKDFESAIRKILRLVPLNVHPLVLNEKEFLRMLASSELNVVKEVVNNYVILYGIENFYKLMKK